MTRSGHQRSWVMVWGSEPSAVSIGYERSAFAGDSGFTVIFDDAPAPEDVPEDNPLAHPSVSRWCLHCLLEEHPEIARGLDIAHEYGIADLDDSDEWVVGDLTRLEQA